MSGLTELKTPHPRYAAEPVPVWAPIDGLGDLTGEFDFQQTGDTDFPAADNAFILPGDGAVGRPGGIGVQTLSAPLQVADFRAYEAQCLESGVAAGVNTTLIRIMVDSLAEAASPTALVNITCTLYLDTEADLSLDRPELGAGQRFIDYRRAADFQGVPQRRAGRERADCARHRRRGRDQLSVHRAGHVRDCDLAQDPGPRLRQVRVQGRRAAHVPVL